MGKKQFYVPTTVQAVSSKSVETVKQEVSSELLAGSSENIYFYSPADTISRLVHLELKFEAISEGISGTKEFLVMAGPSMELMRLVGNHDSLLLFKYSEPVNHTNMQPADLNLAKNNLNNISFTENEGFRVKITNNSDASTFAIREVGITVEREVIKS